MIENRRRYGHPELPYSEQIVYWLSWLFFSLYPFYDGYRLSKVHHEAIPKNDMLVKGWFGYYKDVTDYEWEFWRSFAFYFIPILVLNSILSKVTEKLMPNLITELQTLVAVFVVAYFLSFQGFLSLIIHPILFLLLLHYTRSSRLMWAFSLIVLCSLHEERIFDPMMVVFRVDYEERGNVLVSIMMCYLRMLSYGTHFLNEQCITSVKKNDDKKTDDGKSVEAYNVVMATYETQISFWHYLFYLPLFFNGPVLTFPKYTKQWSNKTKHPFNDIIFDILTCLVYAVLLDLSLHFIYISCISNLEFLLEDLNGWESTSIAWMHLQKFLIKYIVFYRTCGILAKIDGLLPPGSPKCVSSLYTFTVMWRDFDRGLHHLLQQIIYIPLGGSRKGMARQMSAIFCCFGFIAVWHGNSSNFWIWSLTNCLGVILEALAAVTMKINVVLKIRHYFTPLMYRRLCAIGGSVCIYFLIYTNTVFLTTFERATIMLKSLNLMSNLVVLFVLYCSAQCSIDVN